MRNSFRDRLRNLREASAAVAIPCLRKDFIVDEFQLVEARANSADAVLLIVAALSLRELSALAARRGGVGLDVLCEVHDGEELQRALDAGCDLIGVNTRDLRTFKVDLGDGIRLGGEISCRCGARGGEWDSFWRRCGAVAGGGV